MKEEIKEILDFDFKSQGERIEINEYERDILKDYITNLQERFNALLEAHKIADELETEYQERNEKAIEKLKTLMPICIMPNNTLIHGTEKARTIEETLNILKGDKE